MRSVTAAAALRAARESQLGYTSRSIVPRHENPAASARFDQSITWARVTPGIVVGSPIPIFMRSVSSRNLGV